MGGGGGGISLMYKYSLFQDQSYLISRGCPTFGQSQSRDKAISLMYKYSLFQDQSYLISGDAQRLVSRNHVINSAS